MDTKSAMEGSVLRTGLESSCGSLHLSNRNRTDLFTLNPIFDMVSILVFIVFVKKVENISWFYGLGSLLKFGVLKKAFKLSLSSSSFVHCSF